MEVSPLVVPVDTTAPTGPGRHVHEPPPIAPPTAEIDPEAGSDASTIAPTRRTLAESRRLGLGPGYHGSLPEAVRRDREVRGRPIDDTGPAHVVERVPDDVRTAMREIRGIEVGDVAALDEINNALDEINKERENGSLPEAVRRDREVQGRPIDDTGPAHVVERVPDDVRTAMREIHGIDVGDVAVHRGSDADDDARRLSARAFTRAAEVFLPIAEGPIDQQRAKSLLAHELTHVYQQRQRITPLPAEDSAEGRALEDQAQRMERYVRGDRGATRAHAERSASTTNDRFDDVEHFMADLVARGIARRDGTGGVTFTFPSGAGVQRATAPAGTVSPPGPGSATNEANWSLAARFGHSMEGGVGGGLQDLVVSEFPLGEVALDEINKERENRERQWRRDQVQDTFARLRLEHLRQQRQRELPDGAFSENDEKQLRELVKEEVKERLDSHNHRVQVRLDKLNEKLEKGQPPVTQLDPDLYDKLHAKLFADAVAPIPDDDDEGMDATASARTRTTGPAMGPAGPLGPPAGRGVAHGPGGPLGHGGGETPPAFTAWADVRGGFAADIATIAGSPFGIDLTDEDMEQLRGPTPAAPPPAQGPPALPGAQQSSAHREDQHTPATSRIPADRLDLDDLSERLWEKFRGRLRNELLIGRERAGTLTDRR